MISGVGADDRVIFVQGIEGARLGDFAAAIAACDDEPGRVPAAAAVVAMPPLTRIS